MATCATIAVVGAGSVATAAIPSSPGGVVYACYQKPGLLANQGAVRVIEQDKDEHCRSNESALQWNQRGTQGATGPAGAQGPAGPAGPAAGSKVYFASRAWPDTVVLPLDQVFHTVLSKSLPPGSYTAQMNAVTYVSTQRNADIECRIPGTSILKSAGQQMTATLQNDLSLTSAFVHAGGPVELSCRGNPGDPSGSIYIQSATLLFTEVASVN